MVRIYFRHLEAPETSEGPCVEEFRRNSRPSLTKRKNK